MVFYDRGKQRWNRWWHRYTRPKDTQNRWSNRKAIRRSKKKLENWIYGGIVRLIGAKGIEQRKTWSKLIMSKTIRELELMIKTYIYSIDTMIDLNPIEKEIIENSVNAIACVLKGNMKHGTNETLS